MLLMFCVCVQVFAKPKEDQEPEVFFYAMMFLVLAGGSGITMFLSVCRPNSVVVVPQAILNIYRYFNENLKI